MIDPRASGLLRAFVHLGSAKLSDIGRDPRSVLA